MKILLTGADGFTGRHFTVRAQEEGHTVLPLQVDLTDQWAVQDAVGALDFDAVVHLAAISFVGHENATAFYAVNVVGTTNLLAAVAARSSQPPRCVLLASSANVYGNCTASPIAETQAPAPVNHYAASKLAMEHMARTFSDRLPLVLTRPFNYTGPGQAQQFVIPKLVDHFQRRMPVVELGNLYVEREYNDVRLVCDAYLALLQSGQSGEVYNVCSGQMYTLQQVVDALSVLTGHHLQVRVNPAFVRANEVHRLCGDSRKLLRDCGPHLANLSKYTLQQTLVTMLGGLKI